MFEELHLTNVGPAAQFDIDFGSRLNLFTGDNGLGKTFLLEIVWYALTRTWVNRSPILPGRKWSGLPQISFQLHGSKKNYKSRFYAENQRWTEITGNMPQDAGLVIYMRVDDGFSVWDPTRAYLITAGDREGPEPPRSPPLHYDFTPHTLWNGLVENGRTRSKGLLADWVSWQYQPEQGETDPFPLLKRVLQKLAPHPDEWMKPGKPTRIAIDDVRDIPTVELPYGAVPVTQLSAGMKRILSLAYLLIWTWYEHQRASEMLPRSPTNKLVLLIDEAESHLHPQWQRSLLPSILDLSQILQPTLDIQIIATTHAPLVLASAEPFFDEDQDRQFLFELLDEGVVSLSQVPWTKQGDMVGWLTSDTFGLAQARSIEAEQAIEAAEALMRGDDMSAYPDKLRSQAQIDQELRRQLADHDPFWPRWLVERNLLPGMQEATE